MLNKIIINKKLILKKLILKNINNNYLSWLRDPSLKKNLVNIRFKNVDELKKYYKKIIEKKHLFFFGIFYMGKHIGNLKFENIYHNSQNASWGILIGDKKYRRRGMGNEILSKSMHYLEKKYNLRNFIISVTHFNKSARKLYYNLGFRKFKIEGGKIFLIRRSFTSKIILGSANFKNTYGHRKYFLDKKKIKSILRFAKINGINLIDTASNYGKSEEVLGKNNLKGFDIISKLPKVEKKINTKKFIEYCLNKTFYKTKRKKIYGYLIHNPNDLFSNRKKPILKILNSLKKQKKIKKIGVSVYEVDQLKKILKIFKPDIVQLPINLLNQSFLKNDFLKKIKKSGIEIHARSIFLQGALIKYPNTNLGKNIMKKMKKVDKLCKKKKIGKICLLLNFVNSIQEIDKIVIGVDNTKQLKQIIKCNENPYFIKDYESLSTNDKNIIDLRLW